MNDVQRTHSKRTLGSKVVSTVLVFTVPQLLLAIIGVFTGSFDLGTPEILMLEVCWVVGLVWVWWPRRS
jgi:hypothetical protein